MFLQKRKILIIFFFIIAQEWKIVTAEWVEIPQFSDIRKVYRGSLYKGVQKFYLANGESTSTEEHQNATTMIYGYNRIQVEKHPGMFQSWITKPTISSTLESPQIDVTQESVYLYDGDSSSTAPTPQNLENLPSEDQFGFVTVENDEDDATVTSVPDHESNEPPGARPQESAKPDDDDSNRSFLYFIPMSLFKKVHATLKSQPGSMTGKMEFLKNFEKVLLAEIQKRLIPVVSPVRKKRESRGDHGWDEHDDSVGFPSLEGALMAISFLTFAVYLVQLVMMLFRNLGSQATPSPGTATVLFNRNKRSTEEFTEHTARILEYLDKYANTRSNDN